MTSQDTFKDVAIDEVDHDKSLSDPKFPSNLIPKSIINFKRYYDLHDKFNNTTNCKTHSSSLNYKIVKFGNELNPQLINRGISCSLKEEKDLIKLYGSLRICLLGHTMTLRTLTPKSCSTKFL